MLIRKVEQRIQQYLTLFDEKKYTSILKLETFVAKTTQHNYNVPRTLTKEKISFPYYYGEEKYNFWFFTSFKIPQAFKNEEIYLYAPTGADSLVFINGEPKGAVNPYHLKLKILDSDKQRETIDIAIEAYSGHIIPGYHPMHKSRILLTLGQQIPSYPITFPTCELLIKNKNVYDLYYDAFVLFDLARQLDDNSLRKNEILRELYYALIQIYFVSDSKTFDQECVQASKTLKKLLILHNSPSIPIVYTIGHAHIDHAWLWPIGETIRKAARTFANMTRLAEEFPEFVFIQSQPAQLELIKEHYPDIFKKILKIYQTGQWEPNGGMWVEADTNIPSGESLIRQFLIGKTNTMENFNYYGDTLWLPDVFGYSANLPQILKGCGIKYFVTSKISWNDTTRFPYDTFNWVGIDGSVIKSHFLTVSYEGFASVSEIYKTWNQVQHKEVQNAIIKPFGEGDGGGGPTRSDLEVTRRINDLEGCPRTSWSKVSTALDKIFTNTHNLPTWNGELYLELHRGTYTTIADTKKYNRKLEQLFRNVEFLSVICTPIIAKNYSFHNSASYKHKLINELWSKFLTNQFHDIIPGSSINQVNVEALASYKAIERDLNEIINELQKNIFSTQNQDDPDSNYVCINSLPWDRTDLIKFPIPVNKYEDLKFSSVSNIDIKLCQIYKDFNRDKILMIPVLLPATGFTELDIFESSIDEVSIFSWNKNVLTTPFYIVTFDDLMQIISLRLKDDSFDYVAEGKLFNTIQFAEDFPVTWDAWDLEWDTFEQKVQNLKPADLEVISDGPLFLQIRSTYKINNSEIIQDILFYSLSDRIDFRTKVNWNEEHKVLRTIFPANISSDYVKCEIQNGYLNRSTLKNRAHERAMFEICSHKWVDLNDGQRGLALLNDSKYGHNINRNQLGLTLLRSPKHPDQYADIGEHFFTYSILAYKNQEITKVIRHAYELNNEPIVLQGSLPTSFKKTSLFKLSNDKIIVECIKEAETGDGVIIRLYEATGSFNETLIHFNFTISSIFETNMLEEKQKKLSFQNNEIIIQFKSFEIKTILVI